LLLIKALEIFEQIINSNYNLFENEYSILKKKKCSEIINKYKGLVILKEISIIHKGKKVNFKSSSI